MQSNFPSFDSRFLNGVSRQFERRRKALSYVGELTVETEQPDYFEWLSINIKTFAGHYVIFQFVEDNRVDIYVRSSRRRDRGKVLFELRDVKLVDNSQAIVESCEKTAREAHDRNGLFEESEASGRIIEV